MYEILTLQLGHRANHLATHFWNTQESYFTYDSTQAPSPVDHDIHFRPGIGARGEETFTPRTLIYDLKGGFGGLKKWGGLYDQQQLRDAHEEAKGVWDGNVVLHTDPQIPQSEYQQSLEQGDPSSGRLSSQTVRYWSDFNRVFYHPRSIVQINDYELGSSLAPFERWESGEELFVSMDHDVGLLDRDVRVWAEECDQMQGIQIFTGGDDAWGGFASRYVERLRDEFGKMAIWAWGVEDEQQKGQRAKQRLRMLNAAKSINEISTYASMYVPLSIPAAPLPQYLNLDRNSQWHISALLSTAVESMTLPSRLRPNMQKRGFLGDMEAALNVNGNQRIAQLQCSVLDPETDCVEFDNTHGNVDDRAPSDANIAMAEEDGLAVSNTSLDMNLSNGGCPKTSTPSIRRYGASDHVFAAVEELRGKMNAVNSVGTDKDEVNHAKKRKRFAGSTIIERYQSPLGYPLLDSFPSIFLLRPDLTKVTVHTSISTTSGVSKRVKALQKLASEMVDRDERESLSNGLGEISEAYEDGWQDGSDEDSDD